MTPAFPDARILVVDDQPANVLLLERLLNAWGYANVVGTTRSSEVVPHCEAEPVDLLLLDLMMPHPDGFEILRQLEPAFHGHVQLPVLVLTGDVSVGTRRRALAAGARDYVTKPFDPPEVLLRVGNLLETRFLQLELERHNATLERRIRKRTEDLQRSRFETLERLALAGEYRDDDTNEHAQRVGRTVRVVAERLGVPKDEAQVMGVAAQLHDIGKIGISDTILLKPGKLSTDEYELMKTHVVIGEQILGGSTSTVLQVSAVIAYSHHERWDGGGYPEGVSAQQIPLAARLAAFADVFDALTHHRPYKPAWPLADALAEVRRLSGSHFDPAVVRAIEDLDHHALLAPIDERELAPDWGATL